MFAKLKCKVIWNLSDDFSFSLIWSVYTDRAEAFLPPLKDSQFPTAFLVVMLCVFTFASGPVPSYK